MTWLEKTPSCLVEVHIEMMEKLIAEESMTAATIAGVGRGVKLGAWIGRQWHKWAHLSRSRQTAKASASDIASAGIRVKVVEKRNG